MVKQIPLRRLRQRGALMTEMMIAITLLTGALLPIAYSMAKERKLTRATYQRAVAMEMTDGELEILAAGAWKNLPQARHVHHITAVASTNLPPGDFWLTIAGGRIDLEWQPTVKDHGGNVVREAIAK